VLQNPHTRQYSRHSRFKKSHRLVATRARRECQDYRGGSDSPCKLSDAVQHEPHGTDTSREEQCQTDIWVEQSASDAVKQPGRHKETEPEINRGDEDVECVRGGLIYAPCRRGCLYSSISESEEEKGANKLEEGTEEVLLEVCEEGTSARGHVG
jgi:hypothetical protein